MNVVYKGPAEWACKVPTLVEYWHKWGGCWKHWKQGGFMTWEPPQGNRVTGAVYMTKKGLVCHIWEESYE